LVAVYHKRAKLAFFVTPEGVARYIRDKQQAQEAKKKQYKSTPKVHLESTGRVGIVAVLVGTAAMSGIRSAIILASNFG
jgi:hypothetical protein